MAGCCRVGFREPDVKRRESSLGSKTDYRKQERQTGHGSTIEAGRNEMVKIQRWTLMRQQDKENEKKGGSDVRCYQVYPSGPSDVFVFILKGYQKKRRQGHDFPCHEKQHAVM